MGEEEGIGCEPALLGAGKTTSNPTGGFRGGRSRGQGPQAVAEGEARGASSSLFPPVCVLNR